MSIEFHHFSLLRGKGRCELLKLGCLACTEVHPVLTGRWVIAGGAEQPRLWNWMELPLFIWVASCYLK